MKKIAYEVVTKEEAIHAEGNAGTCHRILFDELDSRGAEAVKLDWKEMGYKSAINCATSIHKAAKKYDWFVHRAGDNVYLIKKEREETK